MRLQETWVRVNMARGIVGKGLPNGRPIRLIEPGLVASPRERGLVSNDYRALACADIDGLVVIVALSLKCVGFLRSKHLVSRLESETEKWGWDHRREPYRVIRPRR